MGVPNGPPVFLFILAVAVILLILLMRAAGGNRRHGSGAGERQCRGCGTSHPTYAAFCRRCGQRL